MNRDDEEFLPFYLLMDVLLYEHEVGHYNTEFYGDRIQANTYRKPVDGNKHQRHYKVIYNHHQKKFMVRYFSGSSLERDHELSVFDLFDPDCFEKIAGKVCR